MQITLQLDFDSWDELTVVVDALTAACEAACEEKISAEMFNTEVDEIVAATEPKPVVMEDANTALPVEEPKKKRGRPAKPKAETVAAGPEVLAQLKASIAASTEDSSNVVPMKKADPIEDAVFGVPEPTEPAAPAEISTGQQLQEYILSLVHQKRLNPVEVKAAVYPKFGVVRSLDLTNEQVPAAKAAIDAMLKDDKPKAANDLDL